MRRDLLSVVAAMTAATCLAVSCGSASNNAVSSTTPGVQTAKTVVPENEGTPRTGGILRFGMDAEVIGISPVADLLGISSNVVASAVMDSLAVVGPDRRPKPYLAESITPNADATVWTIKVQPNVKFHDGTPLDAAAVVTNIETQRSGLTSFNVRLIKQVVATGPLTVEVRMNQPWVSYDWVLTTQLGYMVSPASIRSDTASTLAVGTGPYKITEWIPGSRIVAKKNTDYWQKGKPYLDEIDFVMLSDPTARVSELQKGTIDLAMTNDGASIAEFRRKSGFVAVEDNTGDANAIVLNLGKEPFDNIHARKALALSTDRKTLVDKIGNGILVPTDQVRPDNSPYHAADSKSLAFDLNAAKAEVEAYKKDTGKQLAFGFMVNDDTLGLTTAQLLQSMWQASGATVTVEGVKQTVARKSKNDYLPRILAGNFDATLVLQFGAHDLDANFFLWHSTSVGPVGSLSINISHTSDAKIDAALEEGRTNRDPDARARAYQTVAQRLNETVSYVFLYRDDVALIAAEKVHGLGIAERWTFARADAKPWLADLWLGV